MDAEGKPGDATDPSRLWPSAFRVHIAGKCENNILTDSHVKKATSPGASISLLLVFPEVLREYAMPKKHTDQKYLGEAESASIIQ